MGENTIHVYGDSIEAMEDGTVLLNGTAVNDLEGLEKVLSLLIKATISLVK